MNGDDMAKRFTALERLLDDWGQSIQRELNDTADGIRREMRDGFDRIDAATKRNTGMIVSGTLAISALKKWTLAQDTRNKRHDTEMRDLRDRLRKLEREVRARRKPA